MGQAVYPVFENFKITAKKFDFEIFCFYAECACFILYAVFRDFEVQEVDVEDHRRQRVAIIGFVNYKVIFVKAHFCLIFLRRAVDKFYVGLESG